MSNRNRSALRWLRTDVRDVVKVVPRTRQRASRHADGAGLSDGLRRWSRRLARHRSLAVVRRQLLLGGTLAAIAALAILIAGGARPWWLAAAGIAFALACGLIAWLRRPSLATSARIVDRALTMNDRLGTALELQVVGASGGLAAVVRDEADIAIGRSLGDARARLAPAGREWAWLAAVVCGLAVLIAVPRGGAAARHSTTTGSTVANGKAGRPGAGGNTRKLTVWAGTGATTPQAQAHVPLTPGRSGRSSNPYKYTGKQYKNNQKPAPVVGPNALAKTPHINVAAPSASGGSAAGGAGGAQSGVAGTQSGSKLGVGKGTGGLQPAAGSGSGSAGGTGNGLGKSGGGSGNASGRAQGSQQGAGSAPPGGESAGSTRAAALGRASGITPVLSNGRTSLPLQSGFLPQAGKGRGAAGSSQTAQGGTGGASRTANVNGNGGAGASGNFAALAPTFNSPSSNPSLQSYYFGTANQLSFKGW